MRELGTIIVVHVSRSVVCGMSKGQAYTADLSKLCGFSPCQSVQNMPKCASASRSDAEAETNKPKNRFQTILPCEQTCVLSYFINGLCFTSFTGQRVLLHDDVLTAT